MLLRLAPIAERCIPTAGEARQSCRQAQDYSGILDADCILVVDEEAKQNHKMGVATMLSALWSGTLRSCVQLWNIDCILLQAWIWTHISQAAKLLEDSKPKDPTLEPILIV